MPLTKEMSEALEAEFDAQRAHVQNVVEGLDQLVELEIDARSVAKRLEALRISWEALGDETKLVFPDAVSTKLHALGQHLSTYNMLVNYLWNFNELNKDPK